MIGQWKALLLEKAAEWDLPRDGEWSFLFNNNYHPHCSNLNLLWFHNGGQFPRVVSKIFRDPEIPKREFESLNKVYNCAPAWVPRPLHFGLQGESWILWMEGVPGLRFQARNRYAPVTLRSIGDMVASMHGGMQKAGGTPDPDRYRRMISEPLETLAQFGASASVRAGCVRLAGRTSVDWLNALPVIPQHGDLFFNNVLSYRSKWFVVDWESFGTIDLPFYDLFTLLFSLLRAGGETPEQWAPSLMKQAPVLIERYGRALGLSPSGVPLLLPLTLANWFHLQWSDGREKFTELMYKAIEHYFERPDLWENVFAPSGSRRNA